MIQQSIFPDRKIFFAGEIVRIRMNGNIPDIPGKAVVRTNIGGAAMRRREQIDKNESGRTPRGGDWRDMELSAGNSGTMEITLPLCEPGVFEAKCCFIPDDGSRVIWANGENFHLKVLPASSVGGNSIYCAFVRQFGKWKNLPHSPVMPSSLPALDAADFTVVPPSGTFRDLIGELDHIFGRLHCNILQLLPIHPVPKCFGRMGRYGSPFAATDYFSVDPALAEFDPGATPMEQFVELIDAVHARNGRVFMDIPVNHTGWASKLQCEHPEYFKRDKSGKFISPGAWGIVWEDLCQLDYSVPEVTGLMAKVFLFWCRHGVDGFRCDAGYMIPEEAWNYIIAKVRDEFPDTVFLLEGLGGPPAVQEKLLASSGLDWGYSELFQNYSRDEISSYFPYMEYLNSNCGVMANFAETHDNSRLAAQGHVFAKLRFLVNAMLCYNGAFGFANGAEFFATEKIDVHGCGALNYHASENLCGLISKINLLLSTHPAFGCDAKVKLVQHGAGNVIAAKRYGKNIPELLILCNLDCANPATVTFENSGFERGSELLSGRKVALFANGRMQSVPLAPGEVQCLSFDDFQIPANSCGRPESVLQNCAAAMAQQAAVHCSGISAAAAASGKMLCEDPVKFAENISGISPAPLATWDYPCDIHREVMLAPRDLLLVRSEGAFIVKITSGKRTLIRKSSLPATDGKYHFALLTLPENTSGVPVPRTLHIVDFSGSKPRRSESRILQLGDPEKRLVRLAGRYDDAAKHYVFGSTEFGSYAMFSAQWGRINSKYDAILAANVRSDYPVDRTVMFTACRAWLVIDEFSQELTSTTLESYCAHPGNRAQWRFILPDGHGSDITIIVEFRMALDGDAVELRFRRESGNGENLNASGAKLILRPDIEDRINHTTIRACDGAEHLYRNSVKESVDGFEFAPGKNHLHMRVPGSRFFRAPEWRYMTDLPGERYYGMNDKNDIFSPGYFSIEINPGEEVILSARVGENKNIHFPAINFPHEVPVSTLAQDALSRFVVRRDNLSTVIAGYPWFLDWGRDTLIVLRGLIKFPFFHSRCADIIRRFAAFEKNGTIPNMICGGNDSNRDTSDAPLYLTMAVRDYIANSGDNDFMKSCCGGRELQEILHSIIDNYRRGTRNGIKMDPESGLIFSPSHFSWMDTNYPAGTPREGYPVEIQALWYAALRFLNENELADKVQKSISELYFHRDGTVSDCLHCHAGVPAAQAVADDHIRCNMLMLITTGAVTAPEKSALILRAAEKLLIPGAIRTLADAPVKYALPVEFNGRVLNNPAYPYQGSYRGPEDTSRKMAYHNGTAWCWPFPAYCEALYILGGEKSRQRAKALLFSCVDQMENGVIGEMPEVMDGHAPHRAGGCLAQAWSISEFYRVLQLLEGK